MQRPEGALTTLIETLAVASFSVMVGASFVVVLFVRCCCCFFLFCFAVGKKFGVIVDRPGKASVNKLNFSLPVFEDARVAFAFFAGGGFNVTCESSFTPSVGTDARASPKRELFFLFLFLLFFFLLAVTFDYFFRCLSFALSARSAFFCHSFRLVRLRDCVYVDW